MTSIASLRMEIQTGDVTRASRELDKMTEAGKKAETQSGRLTTATGGMAQAMSSLKRAIAGVGIIELGRQIIGAADAMTLIDARMKLATKGAAEFASAQREVYRIAQTNMVGLQETATLYTRLAEPVRRLGGTSRETSAIVEAFATSLRLSGASSGEAASATLQFSQAMASGALRGEEFNSVNEAAPRLMRAVADSMGVTTGELRSMAAEGKLTAGVVGNALAGSLQTLQAEAGQIPLTVGGAMQQVANETLVLVGKFNELTGGSESLAEMIGDYLTPAIRGLYSTAVGVVEVFNTLGTGIGGVLAAIKAALTGNFSEARQIMGMLADDITKSWERAGAAINSAWAPSGATTATQLGNLNKLSEAGTKTEKSAKGASTAQKRLNDLIRDALDLDKQRQKALDDIASRELDRLRRYEEQEAAENAKAQSAADMLRAIEFETQALQMSNVEREIAVAMLKLEEQGIVAGTAAYEAYAEAIRGAIVDRDAVRRSVEQTKEIQREYEQMSDRIGQSLSDALMNGGKSAADYLKGLFRNLVLQPLLRPIGAALGGFGGMAGTASAATGGGGSSLGMVGNIAGISGAFGTGLASSFGSMAAAGVGGWASAAGSLLGSGSMAGFAAGAGMVAAPLIAAAVVASLFKGGETRAGGRYGMVGGQAAFLEGPSGGQVGPMAEAVQSVIDSINATLTAVGSQVAVTAFAAGVETSKNSRGGAFAGGALSTGATFGDTTDAVGWRYTENLDASDAGARFARELQMATLEALRSADLGGSIGQILSETDIGALSDDALAGLITQIQSTVAGVNAFRDSIAGLPMDNLAGLSFAAADQLAALSGGVENLSQRLAGYYENYYTEAERSAALTAQLTGIFGEMGMSLPSSRDAFREIVDAQDLTTEAGRQTYAALLGVADAFAQVTPAAEIAAEVFEETLSQALERMRSRVRSVDDIAANIIDLEGQLARERAAGDVGAMRELDMSGLTEIERGLMQQIYALQDAREAEAQAAQQAADSIREAAAAQEAAARQRDTLERQIMQLSGDTAAIRAAEIAALDPANRALQERIYALQDAAAAEQSSAAAAQRIASERAQLESRVLQLVGDTAAIRAAELAALDPSNRALLERIYALEDEASAAQVAADAARALADEQRRVASERAQLERQLLEISGDTAAIRALELSAVDATNRALLERIYALEDEALAAQVAADAARALADEQRRVASERAQLERQLLEINGDTAAIRALDIAALDESNRALQQQIWARQDQIAAEAEATRIAEQARQAAEQAAAESARRIEAIANERQGLERQLMGLLGDTAGLRAMERAALDESNRALYDRIAAIQDQQAAEQAAAQARADRESRASAIAAERDSLEMRILQLQGNTAAIRERERAALDVSNRGLYDRIVALEAIAEAEARATAILDERRGIERQMLQAQGDTVAIRALELSALDASNRALQEQVWAIQDAAAITAERAGLESRLLQLQGNTAELRARELAQLDESNRAIQQQIWALEDAAKAWGGVTDAIENEVRRIRGLSERDQSLSAAQAKFAIASAQARAGDADAAGLLPGLSQSLLAAAERQATTFLELERLRAATANSLEQTAQIIETKPPESMSIDFAPVVTTLETLRSDSRAQSAATISLINRLVKIVEGWEAQGIPEERAV